MSVEVENLFRHHELNEDQFRRTELLRTAAQRFVEALRMYTQESANRTLAIRHIEDALMRANKAIAEEK